MVKLKGEDGLTRREVMKRTDEFFDGQKQFSTLVDRSLLWEGSKS